MLFGSFMTNLFYVSVKTLENFDRVVWRVLEKFEKVRKWLFLVNIGVILAISLTSQSYDFDAIASA